MFVGNSHPLSQLFRLLVRRRLYGDAQLRDTQICSYISTLLTEFAHARNLFKARDARGKRLEDVGEMLIESNPLLEGRYFDREREVRRHIGDYTLFLSGLFPEYVATLPGCGLRLDALVDYVKAGKESYRIVAAFNQFEYREEAPLFHRLSDSFEICVFGLNLVKQDPNRLQQPSYRYLRSAIWKGQ